MKKTLRGVAAAMAASACLLTLAVLPAGATAYKIDTTMKADLKLTTAPSPQLTMGGSSFDGPLVQAAETQWNSDTGKAAFSSYAVTKSGTGRANVIAGAYRIGFSDFPMNQGGDCDLGGSPVSPAGTTCSSYTSASENLGEYVQVPVVLAGVAIIFHFGNLSGTASAAINKYGLAFKGLTLGQIFAGKITNWDSTSIVNAHLNTHLFVGGKSILPNSTIAVISRTSGSGTTFGFKDYLSEVDPADFPTPSSSAFTAALATYSNSPLLAPAVASTPDSIGYVEFGYAAANDLQTALIVNKSGKSVALTEAGIIEAATVGLEAITASSNHTCHALGGFSTANIACFAINNETGAKVYPISLFSYAIVPKVQTNLVNATAEVKFLDFLSHQGGSSTVKSKTFGQDLADANGYAPLPVSMQAVARALLLKVTVGGHAVL